jgi:hypothetical protein
MLSELPLPQEDNVTMVRAVRTARRRLFMGTDELGKK